MMRDDRRPGVVPDGDGGGTGPTGPLVGADSRSGPRDHHQVLRPLLVVLGGYVALAAGLIVVGSLLTHAAFLAPLRRWDESVNRWFVARRTPGLTRISGWLSALADTLGVTIVAVALAVLLALRRRARWALLVVIGLPLELAVFLTVNLVVNRPRPAVARVGSTPSTHSFPSGHVAATIVLYGGMALLAMRLWRRGRLLGTVAAIGAGALALAVGWARVYRGMHHPTDVLLGAVMGLGCLIVAVEAHRQVSAGPAPVAGFPTTGNAVALGEPFGSPLCQSPAPVRGQPSDPPPALRTGSGGR